MKKRIVFSFLVIVLVLIFMIGNVKDTTVFSGVLVGIDNVEVDVKITRTNFDKIFNKMSEDIIVEGKGVNYRYIFSGHIFEMEGYYATPIRRMSKTGLASQGYLLFDDKMKNIIIETNQERIYSAEEDFVDMVVN